MIHNVDIHQKIRIGTLNSWKNPIFILAIKYFGSWKSWWKEGYLIKTKFKNLESFLVQEETRLILLQRIQHFWIELNLKIDQKKETNQGPTALPKTSVYLFISEVSSLMKNYISHFISFTWNYRKTKVEWIGIE